MGIFDTQEIGNWQSSGHCRHQANQNYSVIEAKWIKIHFHWRVLARILRPLADLTGYTKRGDSYDHHAIFIDLQCDQCQNHTVVTIEFQKNGPSLRYGYYRSNAKLVVSAKGKRDENGDLPAWSQIDDIYKRFQDFGEYHRARNNCQDFVRAIWPQIRRELKS